MSFKFTAMGRLSSLSFIDAMGKLPSLSFIETPARAGGRAHTLGDASWDSEPPRRQKSMKCAALLASLILVSAGVNYIFIGTAGGKVNSQPQQVQREGSTLKQTSAVECAPESKYCSLAVR
jgi:hypothetical protein